MVTRFDSFLCISLHLILLSAIAKKKDAEFQRVGNVKDVEDGGKNSPITFVLDGGESRAVVWSNRQKHRGYYAKDMKGKKQKFPGSPHPSPN